MKKLTCLAAGLTVLFSGNAQQKSETPDVLTKKREIALSVTPLISGLIGAYSEPRAILNYKLFYNDRNAIRIGGSGALNRHEDYSYPISSNDSTITERHHTKSRNYTYGTHVGFEHNWGKKKLTCFTGVDLLFSVTKKMENYYDLVLEKNEKLNYYPIKSSYPVTFYKSVGIGGGVRPFIGIKYPFTKHLSASAQMGADMVVYANKNYLKTQNNPDEIYKNWTADFNMYSLISDISLIYTFGK